MINLSDTELKKVRGGSSPANVYEKTFNYIVNNLQENTTSDGLHSESWYTIAVNHYSIRLETWEGNLLKAWYAAPASDGAIALYNKTFSVNFSWKGSRDSKITEILAAFAKIKDSYKP